MAFGYRVTNGDFLPICKFDARSGRFFKVNKEMGGTAEDIEIPNGTKFAVDFGTLEAGWVTFGAQGPIRQMQPYIEGQAPVQQPPDKDQDGKSIYRPGFYVKLAGNALDGIREWIGASAAVMNAMDELYTVACGLPEMAQGKIPIVHIASSIPIKSGSGAKTSTNYAPVFQIDTWTDRPDQLGPRTVPLKANGTAPPVTIATMPPAQVAQMAAASVPAQQTSVATPAPGMPF